MKPVFVCNVNLFKIFKAFLPVTYFKKIRMQVRPCGSIHPSIHPFIYMYLLFCFNSFCLLKAKSNYILFSSNFRQIGLNFFFILITFESDSSYNFNFKKKGGIQQIKFTAWGSWMCHAGTRCHGRTHNQNQDFITWWVCLKRNSPPPQNSKVK